MEADHLLQGEQFRPPNENEGLHYHSSQVAWRGSLEEAFCGKGSSQGYTQPLMTLSEVIMQNFSIQQKGTGIAQTWHLYICKLFQLHHYLIKLAVYVIKLYRIGI